jgi:sarcosine oxidase subunit gamma
VPAGFASLSLEERSDVALCSVLTRQGCAAPLAARVKAEFGISLPTSPKYVSQGALAFVWAGPNQWLALASGVESSAFGERLRTALSDVASVVEQSDGRTVARISGPRARDALAKGVLIDLHPRAFRPGDTALTVVSYINVHFWQLSELPEYEFTVFRSFATAFSHWLVAAASEYGPVDFRRNVHPSGYFPRDK